MEENFANLRILTASFPVVAALVGLALQSEFSKRLLLCWYCSVLLAALASSAAGALFTKRRGLLSVAQWMKVRVGTACLSGVVWGVSLATFLYPVSDPGLRVFVVLLVGGTTVVALGSSASVLPALLAFQLVNMVPFMIRMLASGEPWSRHMAGLMFFFLTVVVVTSVRMNRAVKESYLLEFDKKELMDELRAQNETLGETVGLQRRVIHSTRTAKQMYERRLRGLHGLLESANVGYVIVETVPGSVVEYNEAACHLLDKPTSGALASETLEMIVGPLHSSELFLGQLLDGTTRSLVKDGIEYILSRSQSHEADLTLLFLRDVSDRIKLEERVQRMGKMEIVGQMAGEISHEFNNLLMGISGYTNILKMDIEPPVNEELSQLLGLCERGKEMTAQLLALSSDVYCEPSTIDLGQHMATLHPMLSRLVGSGVELRYDLCSDECPVFIDPSQLDRTLFNLVLNAKDATSAEGTISISLKRAETGAVIEVSDDGPGVSGELSERIFEPFFTTKRKGNGIGLTVCSRLVTSFGGRIALRAGELGGASFTITIPLASKISVAATDQSQTTPPRTGLGARILVVETEVAVRAVLTRELEKAGHTVICADSNEQALQIVGQSEGRIDLVVAEVTPSQVSGFELKESLGEKAPPFIFTNVYIQGQDPSFEGCRFLRKPLVSDELQALVQQALDENP